MSETDCTNANSQENNNKTIKYIYKRTVDPEYWMNYLSRNLTNKEKHILAFAKKEQMINREIEKIFEIAKNDDLYIPALTAFSGNCLFESFEHLGLCEDHKQFRIGIANLLLILKTVPNFLPGFSEPLGEVFNIFKPELDLVKCKITGRVYKYDYDAMCVDLATDTSWTRIHTQLIMTILCTLLNLDIVIYRSDGHITHVNENPNSKTVSIYLAHLGTPRKENEPHNEFHYIPLMKNKTGEKVDKCLLYKEDISEYHKWARAMSTKLGRIEIVE